VEKSVLTLADCEWRVAAAGQRPLRLPHAQISGCYRCSVLKPVSSLDPVNLLSLCFGYCRPPSAVGLEQIQLDVTKVLKERKEKYLT